MSRLGDTIRAGRIKDGLTEKQLARKTGCAESFIKDVEAGRRILSDAQAQRILKALGAGNPVSTELEVAAEPEIKLRPKPRAYIVPAEEKEIVPEHVQKAQNESNDAWLDALGGVVKRVPVIDEDGVAIDHVLFPVVGGKIEGGAPDKVVLYRLPDNLLSGFKMHAGDMLLTVPEKTPLDDAYMLVSIDGKRLVRKIRKMDGSKLMLQTYDREFKSETMMWAQLQILGRCVKLLRSL